MGHFLYGGHNSVSRGGLAPSLSSMAVNGSRTSPVFPPCFFRPRLSGAARWTQALLRSLRAYDCGLFFIFWTWVRGRIGWKKAFVAMATLITTGFSLGLCQLAPTFQFARLSNRWSWDSSEIMRDCFVPENFHFLINPFFMGIPENNYHGTGGYAEVVIYLGVIPIGLALVGLGSLLKRPIVQWLGVVAVLSMALAMADSTLPTHYVFLFFSKIIPGLSHNREVSRIMVLTTFALACLAGLALDAWARYWRGKSDCPVLSRQLS